MGTPSLCGALATRSQSEPATALSADSLWREHSWAWDREGNLVETTETRTRYFGVRLDGPEADWFADWIASSETG